MAADLEGEKTLECVAGRTHRQHFSSPDPDRPTPPAPFPRPARVFSLSCASFVYRTEMGKKGTELEISVLSEIADAFDGSFFSFLVETIRTK